MKLLLGCLAIFLGQMIPLQEKPVVHLQPNRDVIMIGFGGKLLELINPPATVYLPEIPPKGDSLNHPWSVDVRNLGPGVVTVTGKRQFGVRVSVGQTVHIRSTGSGYSLY
jgi:hypothetical protein